MLRRSLLAAAGTLTATATAGCLGGFTFSPAYYRDATHVDFTQGYAPSIVSVRNDRDSVVEVTATAVADGDVTTDAMGPRPITPGNTVALLDAFHRDADSYTVSVSAAGETTEQTVRPSESSHDNFEFTITDEGIRFDQALRPLSDFGIANWLDERIECLVAANGAAPTTPDVYDTVVVAPDSVASFYSVLEIGGSYDLGVYVDGMYEHSSFSNSSTNGLSIVVDTDGLDIDLGQE